MRSTLFALGGTLAVQLMVSMAVVTVPVLAPAAARGMAVSTNLVGVFVAIVYCAGMATSLFSGAMVQRFGAMRVSQGCLVICGLGLACVASGVPGFLVAGAILLGSGYGPITPASSHVLAKTTPPGMMSFVFSLKQTGVPLGGALAGAVVPILVLLTGWRLAALAVGAICLLTAGATQPLRAALDEDRDRSRRLSAASLVSPLRSTFGDPSLRRLALSSLFFGALQLSLVTYLVTYLVTHLGLSLVRAGLMLTTAQAGGVVGRLVFGALADRCGRPALVLGGIAVGMGLAAAFTATLTPQWPPVVIAIVCAAFGATAIGWNGVYLAEVARLAPPGKASDSTGGALFITYAGVLFGPPAFALLTESGTDYASAFIIIAAPAVFCGLWLLWRELHSTGGGQGAAAQPGNK